MAWTVEEQKKSVNCWPNWACGWRVVITSENWHWQDFPHHRKAGMDRADAERLPRSRGVAHRVNATWMTVVPGNYRLT